MKTKIIIDPLVNIYYASFYIQALMGKFGIHNIIYKSKPFKSIHNRIENFNFIVLRNNKETKFSIQFNDTYEISKDCYNWCDIYGNVNTNWKNTPNEYKEKLISLAPSFGIRLWGFADTIYYAISNSLKRHKLIGIKKFLGKYKRLYKLRLPLENYIPKTPLENYIFHVSTLWQSDEYVKNDEFVNRHRAIFMETCKSISEIKFEGGFYYTGKHSKNQKFKNLIINDYIPAKEYVKKLRQSIVVFNTPAWLNCNGWKLAEYLALGKAIISTPLLNDLPKPLTHGENVHFVKDEEEIKRAILLIVNDVDYRQNLETGAREYWEQYGKPLKSLELLGIK